MIISVERQQNAEGFKKKFSSLKLFQLNTLDKLWTTSLWFIWHLLFCYSSFFSYIKCRNFAPLMEIYEKSVGIPLSLAQFLSKHLQTNLIVRKNVDARRENKFMMCLRNLMNLEEIRGNSWTGTSIFKPSKLNDSKKLGVKTVFRLIHLVLTISKWYLVLSGKILILIKKLMLLMITIC